MTRTLKTIAIETACVVIIAASIVVLPILLGIEALAADMPGRGA